ncbi:MAG: membrane protein insertase YidC [Lentisphaeria bacterium]|nr:membrane protein insertase YidC [Lentisphaeria bacterium]
MKVKSIDKESLIVIGIALILLIAWGVWYPRYQAKQQAFYQEQQAQKKALNAQAEKAQQLAEQKTQNVTVSDTKEQKTVLLPKTAKITRYDNLKLENKLLSVVIDPNNGVVETVTLKQYDTSDKKTRIVFNSEKAPLKTAALLGLDGWKVISTTRPKVTPDSVSFSRILVKGNEKMQLTQVYSLPADSYHLNARLIIENLGKDLLILPQLHIAVAGLPPMQYLGGDKLYNTMHRIEYCGTTSKAMISLDPTMKEEKFKNAGTNDAVDWIGSSNKYFASLLFADPVFDHGVDIARKPYPVPGKDDTYYIPAISGKYQNVAIKAAGVKEFKFNYFSGPKTLAEVKKLPESAMPILHISSFSLMEYLARPVLWLLNYLNDLCGSYGIAIILLTLIVRIVFFPLTERGNRSMRKMQKIAPKAKEIREKYKSNPQLMNQKTMELYRQEGVNPVGGCLPILLQIPVFFALYAALDSAVELRHVSFLWATDLTKPDLVGPQFFFGYGIHPLVLAMTALMVLQQKMTPNTMEPAQQKMMMAMPVIMLVLLYNLPSGLTLYWTVSQIFSILQMKYSQYVSKREEAKAADASKANPA